MPLRTPLLKKRTALLRKLKVSFRRYRSQPTQALVARINPILRGWVNYFSIRALESVLLVHPKLGGKEDSAPPGASPIASGLRLEAVE